MCACTAGVYTATELFMLTDYSPGYADTWQSLDRRLQDVRRLGGAASEVLNGLISLKIPLPVFAF